MKNLSKKQQLALDLLHPSEERYGMELVNASGGKLKRGTVYPVLYSLEKLGLVESTTEPQPAEAIGPPKRLYRISAKGLRVKEAARQLSAALAGDEEGVLA